MVGLCKSLGALRCQFRLACAVALATAIVLSSAGVLDACPTCKVALASHDKQQGDLVRGFFWSILFMLSMPFATMGGLSGYFYWQVRKARSQRAALPAGEAPSAPENTPQYTPIPS